MGISEAKSVPDEKQGEKNIRGERNKEFQVKEDFHYRPFFIVVV